MIEPTYKYRKAVYAGSFDPPTNGHLWMIAEAQLLFDELVVALVLIPINIALILLQNVKKCSTELLLIFPM